MFASGQTPAGTTAALVLASLKVRNSNPAQERTCTAVLSDDINVLIQALHFPILHLFNNTSNIPNC